MMLSEASEPAVETASGDRVTRNVTLLSGSLVVTSLLTAVWTLFVPRRIGPQGMGLIVMAWSAANIFQSLGSLGIRTFLVRELAADWRQAPRLVGSAMILRVAAIIPCLAVTALYLRLGHFGADHALVLYLATGVALCILLCEPFLAAFQAIERMEYLAYGDVINKTLLSICGIVLVLLGFGATTLVGLMGVAVIVVLGLAYFWSRPYFAIDWQLRGSRLRRLVRDSLPYWTYGLFSNFYLWIDSAILAVLTPTAVVGWYGGPTKLFGSLMFVPVILATAWLPRLVAAFTQSPERLRQVARVPTEQVMILSLPVSAGAVLIADPLVRFLYGPAYGGSVPVFVILALTVPPTYFNIVVYQILVAAKRQMTWTKAIIAASIINPLLNLVLIRVFQSHMQNGAIGAALSFLLTEAMLVVIGLIVVRPFLQTETLFRLARSGLATVGMAGAVAAASHLGLLSQMLIGILSFSLLAVLFGVVTSAEVREFEGRCRRWLTGRLVRWTS